MRLGEKKPRRKTKPAFVELMAQPSTAPDWVVEVESTSGVKMRIQGNASAPPDWANLLRAWRETAEVQMCDALSRNVPKLSDGAEILLANCLAHGRRQFVEVAANFPGDQSLTPEHAPTAESKTECCRNGTARPRRWRQMRPQGRSGCF